MPVGLVLLLRKQGCCATGNFFLQQWEAGQLKADSIVHVYAAKYPDVNI